MGLCDFAYSMVLIDLEYFPKLAPKQVGLFRCIPALTNTNIALLRASFALLTFWRCYHLWLKFDSIQYYFIRINEFLIA